MIVWCAYCQTFQGETPPFERLTQTHSICSSCLQMGLDHSDTEMERLLALASLNRRFWHVGRRADLAEVRAMAEHGIAQGIRPIDLLFGLAAPALARVGELWAADRLCSGDEHRFTTACEQFADVVEALVPLNGRPGHAPGVLLVNVEGNSHQLGARFAHLGLRSMGIPSRLFPGEMTPAGVLRAATMGGHDVIGLSVATFDHLDPLMRTIDALLGDSRFGGRIVVGGAAINAGLTLPTASSRVHLVARPRFDEAMLPMFATGESAG